MAHKHHHHDDGEPTPQSGEQIQFNVTAVDPTGALITKPLVIRIDAGLSGTVRATNPANFYAGPAKTPAWVGDVEVIADGYAPWTTGANPQVTFSTQTVNVVATLQPSFNQAPVEPILRGPLPPFAPPYTYPYIPGMDVLPWPSTESVSVLDAPDALRRNPSSRLEHWRHRRLEDA